MLKILHPKLLFFGVVVIPFSIILRFRMGTSETPMDSRLVGHKKTLGAFTLVEDGQDNIMLSLRVVRGQETNPLSLLREGGV